MKVRGKEKMKLGGRTGRKTEAELYLSLQWIIFILKKGEMIKGFKKGTDTLSSVGQVIPL